MSDRFEKFLKTLNQSELEMTSFEIADMCWLLLHASQISDRRESKIEQRVTSRDITIVEDNNEEFSGDRDQDRNRNNLSSSLSSKQKKPAGKLFPQEQPKAKLIRQEDKSLTFKVDNPTDLGSSLFLARALKPLLRRVPTIGRSEVLDEIATVDNYAATDKKILAPIFKPALEPWLELALVIDDNVSMDIWHQTIADLITFLGNYGIFRNVQVWKLASQQENLSLYKGLNIAKSRVASPKEILNPDGRRVIILVSDCVANYWHDGRIFPFLEQWSKNTFAILQMLPEWLWLRTSLSSGAKVTFVSNEPGVTNSRLRVKDISLWEDVFYDKNRLQIPLFTLEPKSLEQWSSVVAGRSNMKVSGFVLTPPKIEKKREFASRASKEFDFEAEQNLTSAERVRRFRNNSTLLAQELAELLAAAPTIFLPVVRLIRREMLPPDAGQVQIAEVFLGGIMKVRSNYSQETDPDLVLYDFVEPEVREILQRSSNRHTTLEVFDRVSKYIAKQLKLSLRDFLAELRKSPKEVRKECQDVIQPFAEVSVQILRTLGGEYARFAQEELKAGGKPEEKPKEQDDFSNFPELQEGPYHSGEIVFLEGIELQTQQFFVDEVEISIFETFEFITAKIERKQQEGFFQRFNPFRREWVITRTSKQGEQFIESLSEEVELEMVLIPSGDFMMGAAPNEPESRSSERPQHRVEIGQPFLMGKYPITQLQWRAVAALPEINRELKPDPSDFKGEKRPVENVSWYEAVEFCQRLSKHTGRDYRLPSEAEWEYACRAGTTTPFHFGSTITTDLANYNGNYTYGEGPKGKYREETTPVDTFKVANNFGLCDVHGNVWEWCLDHWHENYQDAPSDGGAWVSGEDSSYRVLRGGSWDNDPDSCRSAARDSNNPVVAYNFVIGFRVMCEVPRTL